MKTRTQIHMLLDASYKQLESKLDIKIRNGQTVEGIKKALKWVLGED